MKFSEKEVEEFKEDFLSKMRELEKKHSLKISVGNVITDDDMFSVRFTCERDLSSENKKTNISKNKTLDDLDIDNLSEEDIDSLDISNLDFEEEKETIEKPKKLNISELDITSMTDEELEELEIDEDFFNDIESSSKKKNKVNINELDIASMTDEEIEALELDDDFFEEEKPKPVKKKVNLNDIDIASMTDEEIEALEIEDDYFEKGETPQIKKKVNLDELDIASMTDEEIAALDIDDDFFGNDELVVNDIKHQSIPKSMQSGKKKVEKKTIKITKETNLDELDIASMTDEEIAALDLSDDFFDEDAEIVGSIENDEGETIEAEFFERKNKIPKNIFEETEDDMVYETIDTYETIDDILSSDVIYSYSFQALLIQSEGLTQDFYTDIKNTLLGYKGVLSRDSWDFDIFSFNSSILSRISIEDGDLVVYLALNCDDYMNSRYSFMDASDDPKVQSTPMKITVRKFKDSQSVCDLIGEMMDSLGIYSKGPKYNDYHSPYQTKEELISKGLIKKL